MTEKNIIRTLKVFIILGICLIILGHSLLASNYLDESLGVHGIMISTLLNLLLYLLSILYELLYFFRVV